MGILSPSHGHYCAEFDASQGLVKPVLATALCKGIRAPPPPELPLNMLREVPDPLWWIQKGVTF